MRFIKNPNKARVVDKLEDGFGEDNLYHISSLPFELMYTLEKTIKTGLSRGSLMSYPLIGVRVKVLDGKYSLKRTNEICIE